MNLLDLVSRIAVPEPWSEGDNIPWHDPAFSARMLREHLSQDHDAASRRATKIDAHVTWIHEEVLAGRVGRVLDLGCGPGLYSSRLARLGHHCVGIDYSPASIAYAREQAEAEGLPCRYVHEDIRSAGYGTGFSLAMLLFGELNVFSRSDAAHILRRAVAALDDGGVLVLEPHTYEAVRGEGQRGAYWYSSEGGLFSAAPHLVLMENLWHEALSIATMRYYVVHAQDAAVTRYAQSMQAYSMAEYEDLLHECGLHDVQVFPSLTGVEDASQAGLMAIVARKRANE
jgi:SAM-dependent methyltransferase